MAAICNKHHVRYLTANVDAITRPADELREVMLVAHLFDLLDADIGIAAN